MTAATPTIDVNTAFVTVSLLPPRTQRAPIIRRPRHGPREGDAPCRCRTSRPRVRCTAGDERDQNADASNQKKGFWLPTVWKWPKADESDGEMAEGEMVSAQSAQNEEEPRAPFRWPWQKDSRERNGVDKGVNGIDTESKVVKKVTHSDSKPGASLNSAKEEEKRNVTWQERWDGFVQIIVPNMKQKGESEDDATTENGDAAVVNRTEDEDLGTTRTGVPELYNKPNGEIGEAKKGESKTKDARWFRISWTRGAAEEEKAEQKDAAQDQRTHRPGLKISKVEDTSVRNAAPQSNKEDGRNATAEVKSNAKQSEEQNESRNSKEEEKESALLVTSKSAKAKIQPLDIVSIPQKDVAAIRLIFGSETFFATETLSPPGGLIFRGNLRGEPKTTLAKLEERLAARLGDKYTLCLAEGEEDLRPVVVVVPTARDRRPATLRQRYIAMVIAFMTITTVMTRGVYAAIYKPIIQNFYPMMSTSLLHRLFAYPNTIAITVSVAIGVVIIMSQIVQRIVASRHGTRIALPYFIPSVQLGSFGAVVQLASPTPTRAALFDIALSGAATLVVLSLTCLLIGLRLSTIFPTVVPVPISTVSNSVLIGFLTQQVPNGQILMDYGRSLIGLHPLAVIGANCLTIAALNLLPIRQLDGGRIISALYGRRTAVVASRVTVLFLLLASTKSPYFVVFLAAITFGPWNMDRPSKNEVTEPNAFRVIVGYLFMLLMIGVLLPFPASKFFGTL